MKPKKLLVAACLFLTLPSMGVAAEEIVKDDFEAQNDGNQLSELMNWKYVEGWIKPEYGKIMTEGGNKYLHLRGDIFSRNQADFEDKLTYKFKVRATGDDLEVGGLVLRSNESKSRYDVLFSFNHGEITLVKELAGKRENLLSATAMKHGEFQSVVVTVEKEASSVRFIVSVDGEKLIDYVDSKPLPLLQEKFTAGFFTYNNKSIDIDSVEFTRGK